MSADCQIDVKGVPDFWLKTLENISLFDEMVQDHDRDILKHLIDIKCVLNTGEEAVCWLQFFNASGLYTGILLFIK